jgi:hypothetical protein
MDLHADIVPGASAAGFSLGDEFHAVAAAIGAFRRWQPEQGHLAAQLATNPGWLYVAPARDGQAASGGASLYFRNNCIRLGFNADTKRICWIEVGAGYQGRLWGEVRVGDTLASAMRHTELHYDSGEELYYPQRPECEGVAFYALEASVGKMPNVDIQCMIVDGATLQRD